MARQQTTEQDDAIATLQRMMAQKSEKEALEAALWQAIVLHQGVSFRTATSLPFCYQVKQGRNGQLTRELLIDRREMSKTLSWSSIRMAFEHALIKRYVARPKALGDIRGVSYVYPLLWRFGVIEVPQDTAQRMTIDGCIGFLNETEDENMQLERITPEQAGLDASRIVRMLDRLQEKKVDIVSMMLVRHGKVLAEAYWAPYTAEQLRTVYSFSKTFTAMAIGIAEGEGILSLDERLVDIFPEKVAQVTPSEGLSALTIRHLLMMSTGQGEEPFHQQNAWKDMTLSLLREPFTEQPGQVFRYNTAATYVLSAVLKKKGVDLEEYLQEKLLTPLEIQGTRWLRDGNGICMGGFGLSLHPEDMARLGQLLLQKGQWKGKQIVPAAYVQAATTKQISNGTEQEDQHDWNQGYGYQMWMCRHQAFRADGMYGQLCVVHPETDTLLVTNCITDKTFEVLNSYWEEVLPYYQEEALPENGEANAQLQARTANLVYVRPVPEDDGGVLSKRLLETAFPEMGMRFVLDGDILRVYGDSGELWYEAGRKAWRTIYRNTFEDDTANMRDKKERPIMAAWGVQYGRLTLKMYDAEFIEENTLCMWQEGQVAHAQIFGTTAGNSQTFYDRSVTLADE